MMRKCQIIDGRVTVAEDGPIWVYANPDDAERRLLVDKLKIDEHTLTSALDPDELSRLEIEPEHVALIFKRPKNYSHEDDYLFKVVSHGLFLFKDKLILVMGEDAPVFDGGKIPFKGTGTPADALLRILYRTIYHFLEHLRVISMITDSLEQKINESIENKHLLSLFKLEKSLVYYLNGINTNGIAIDKLKNAAQKLGLTQEQVEFLDDLAIENHQCYRQAEIYSNILASLMDARVSIVNNNLSVLMKTLNIITLTIMVPTFVVSAFSMNVAIPLQHHPQAFWGIMGLALLAATIFMVFWRFRR